MWYLKTERKEDWAWIDSLSDVQCAEIIKYGDGKFQDALVGIGEYSKSDTTVRKSQICWVDRKEENNWWIYETVTDSVNHMNDEYFFYDLVAMEDLQLTKYEATDTTSYYGKHLDAHTDSNKGSVRKLSFSILLSDPKDFEGGDLVLHLGKDPTVVEKVKGRATFFPSHTLHEVTPVTKGVRYSLVGWVCGPRFR